ncbi:hypothetical protein [Brevundimonas diminuta]|uniref:hypothetical protein n=1 Tax=Brevundimonas diminuta TaxID=293 RepID=UPI003208E36D
MKRLILLSLAALLVGCADLYPTNVSGFSCADVEKEVIRISEGEIIKIMGGKETRRSERELVCHGTGIYSSNDDVRTRYKVYLDADNDLMFSYDVDEEIERRTKAAEAEWDREMEAAQREIDREAAQAERELRAMLQGY